MPTFKELGYDIEFYVWAGLLAPKNVPPHVMTTLRKAVRQAVQGPELKTAMEKLQNPIGYLDADEFNAFWERDAQTLAAVIKRIGKIETK